MPSGTTGPARRCDHGLPLAPHETGCESLGHARKGGTTGPADAINHNRLREHFLAGIDAAVGSHRNLVEFQFTLGEAGLLYSMLLERAAARGCIGYPECDGDLVATPHSLPCPKAGPADAPKEDTHMSHGSTVPGNDSRLSPVVEAERLLAKITVGEWFIDGRYNRESEFARPLDGVEIAHRAGSGTERIAIIEGNFDLAEADAEFMAAAPRLVRELLALLRAQESQPAQVAQPSNYTAFLAGPADAGSHDTLNPCCAAALQKAAAHILDDASVDGVERTIAEWLIDLAASASAHAVPRETK
jgi:hypothetical protein